MKKRNHVTRNSVRKELVDNGLVTAFSSPGRPELWCKPGDKKTRFAVQRETLKRSERWHIIPYPDPSSCTPEKSIELTARDGVVSNADQSFAPGQITVESEFEWMDDK